MNAEKYLEKKQQERIELLSKCDKYVTVFLLFCTLFMVFGMGRAYEYYSDYEYRQKVENYQVMEEAVSELTRAIKEKK